MSDATSPVESIDRALRVLQALAGAGAAGMPLADLAAGVGLTKSTVHRVLAALRFRDFVTQSADGAYVLGPSATHLAQEFYGEENLPVLLHAALVSLSAATDELVHLGVMAGNHVVYLDKVEPERAVRVWSAIGRRSPAVTTALGRALLAHLGTSRPALEGYARGVDGVDVEHVWAAIERARARGYATEREENEPGISCIAVPLVRAGAAVAALSVTAPAERMTDDRMVELYRTILEVLPPLLPADLALPGVQGTRHAG